MKTSAYLAGALFAIALVQTPAVNAAVEMAAVPTVTVEPSRIVATGITRGGKVLFFGAGMEPKKYYAIPHRWSSVVADTTMTGTVSYDLGTSVTWNAIWVVADLSTGRYIVTSTPGFPAERSRLTRKMFNRDTHGAVNRFTYQRPSADFLYIAPGGAWSLPARDGDTSDADGIGDGYTTIDLSRLQPAGAQIPLPGSFMPGGTLLVLDPVRLDLVEININENALAAAH